MMVKIGNTISKLTPKTGKAGRPRKAEAPAAPSTQKSAILDTKDDYCSDHDKVIHHLVVELEKREREHRKRTGQKFTEGERQALWEELDSQLNPRERAALDEAG
jgi:hypothetical protein